MDYNDSQIGNVETRDLSFSKLTAMIIGSTIGGGIFTTAGDMAFSGAHTASVLIGWIICGIGMYALMMCFFGLNSFRPDLTNGIYSYAKEGFGSFVGFNSAWGYWVSALLCNVSYTTLLFGALGYFFPIFASGNNLLSIVCASILIWLLNWLILKGVKEAAAINVITTIAKLIPIFVFILSILLLRKFSLDIFFDNFWGDGSLSLSSQIKKTTSATVWSFIGVEGAVVLSARAKETKDVGRASLAGFFGIFIIYFLVAVLSMGVLTTDELASLESPQMAGILEVAIGPIGASLVNLGVVLSLAGALLGWTILAADCPSSVSNQGGFPKAFSKLNRNGSPWFSLYFTNGLVQLFLIIIYFSQSTYQMFYTLSTTMIMIPYLLSAMYYFKLVFGKSISYSNLSASYLLKCRIFAILGTIYGFWMIYSSGLNLTFIASVLYAPGIIVYAFSKREKNRPIFSNYIEIILALIIVVLCLVAIYLIVRNGAF